MRILTKISRVEGYLVMFGIFGKHCIVNAGVLRIGGIDPRRCAGAQPRGPFRWLSLSKPPGPQSLSGLVRIGGLGLMECVLSHGYFRWLIPQKCGTKPPGTMRLSKPPDRMLYFSSHSLSCFFEASRRQPCSNTSSSNGLRAACSQRAM